MPSKGSLTAAALFAAAAGGCAYAGLSAESQLFGRTLVAPRDPTQIALTYDDGPNPAATPQLLDVLAGAGIRATFFLIGRFVRQEPALTRSIAAEGHVIGNHTMTHPWLAWQSAARIREELSSCNAALEDALGTPVHFFRPPHGARRPYVLKQAQEQGLITVQWNILAGDWKPIDATTILNRVQRGIARNQRRWRGSIIVLHDGSHEAPGSDRLRTVESTRQLLRHYSPERFVTPEGLQLASA